MSVLARALRADRRRLSVQGSWTELFGCRLGWLHRAVWNRGPDRRGDGDLSEEAVARRKAAEGHLTRASLHAAVMEAALLRLRPKVMTVATVVPAFAGSCGPHAPARSS